MGIFGFLRQQKQDGSVAQSVEQRIENPCVGGSIPPRATNFQSRLFSVGFVVSGFPPSHVGFRAILRVPPLHRYPSIPAHFLSRSTLLCSQKIVENSAGWTHAERLL